MLSGEEEVAYIGASDLLEMVKRDIDGVVVIDVRTDDFEGGKYFIQYVCCCVILYILSKNIAINVLRCVLSTLIKSCCVLFNIGHISVASNVPVDEWEDDVMITNIIQSHVSENKNVVVFHCMYSQMRGPFCAKRYFYKQNIEINEFSDSIGIACNCYRYSAAKSRISADDTMKRLPQV